MTRPIRRKMDLTPELVALCERPVADPGIDPRWATEQELRAFSSDLIARRPKGRFWLFAYGSLIWNPTFESVSRRRGTARGWHRSFCLELDSWRATPEQRGLMMALDHGGSCAGVLFELAEEGLDKTIYDVVWREVSFREDLKTVRWLTVMTAEGPVEALTFWAGPKGEGILRKLPLADVAQVIARACGHIGSNAAYLYNTVVHLEAEDICDRNLWHLQRLVADEIRALYRAS